MMKWYVNKPDEYAVLKIIAIYAIFSGLWIYLSDTLLGFIIADPAIITRISVYKGFLFVIVTSLLLYQLVSRYPNEYSQVVLNILCNAKDALLTSKPHNPRVIITTKVEGGRSVVTISDIAGGISSEILYKVFDPFFSTKGAHGTGIGLSMSKYIIERNMNGLLSVINNEVGAEFRIIV